MQLQPSEIDSFYTALFTQKWCSRFPYPDEAGRSGKVCCFLSQIAHMQTSPSGRSLRILDVGCGRGWLTRLASIYGKCDGVDPVAEPVKLARLYFPDLNFFIGTARDVRKSEKFQPYDVVISSEVIEHVLDKDEFVSELESCLVPGGHLIITTPRGELFRKWRGLGNPEQPIESWISESELRALFERHDFEPIMNDRFYSHCATMSFLHRVCASRRIGHLFSELGLTWLHSGMQYSAALYQVWWFSLRQSRVRTP